MAADAGDRTEQEQQDQQPAVEVIWHVIQKRERLRDDAARDREADGVEADGVVRHDAGKAGRNAVHEVRAAGALDVVRLQELAHDRADEQDRDGRSADGHAADDAQQDGDELGLTRGLAGVVELFEQHVKHAAALEHLEQREHEEAEADDIEHAGQAGADGAGGRKQRRHVEETEHQAQHKADQIADDERADEVPATEHQDDHDDRDDEHDERLGIGGVDDVRQRDGRGRLDTDDDEQHGGNDAGDQRIRQTGAHDVAHFRVLRERGGDGRVGNGGEVIAEDRAADDGADHDGGIRTDGRRDGQQHRQHGDDGTVGRAAGRRDQQADEKRHQRQEARAQAELHHKPGQALNEAALAQLLRQDAGQQEREDNDTQRVVFQAVHDRLFKFLFVFCQQECHTQSGETCHAEQHQGHFLHRGDHDHEAHEDQQRRTRAERAPVKLHTFVFLHCEVLLSNNPTPVLLYAVFLALLCVKVN